MAREQFQTLTEPMYYILLALLEECCGVDIMEKVKKISKGRVKVRAGDALCHAAPVCGGGNDLSDCGGGEAQVIPDYGKRQADAAGGIHPADGSGGRCPGLFYRSLCSLMIRPKAVFSFSAAFRQRTMRWRKISK